MKNRNVHSSLVILVLGALSSFAPHSTQAFQLPGSSPEYKFSTGLYDLYNGITSGLYKIGSATVDVVYGVFSKGASATGVKYAWQNNKELTALGLAAATALAAWGVYRYGKSRGKKEMARSIARSIENEESECRYL